MLTVVVLIGVVASRDRRLLVATGIVVLALMVVPIAINVISAPTAGLIWQGRYSLPMYAAFGVLGMLAWRKVLDRAASPAIIERSLRVGACAVFAVAEIVAFWQALRRYTVGSHGKVWLTDPLPWQPDIAPMVLIMVNAIAGPPRRARARSARRCGSSRSRRPSALTALMSSAYVGGRKPRGGTRPELRVAFDDERRGERQPLRAHRCCGRDRTPLADRRSAGERRSARAEAVGRTPGEYGLRHLHPPRDPAFPRLSAVSAVSAVVAERCERGRVAVTKLRRSRGKQSKERRIRGSNDSRSARRSRRNQALSVAVDVLNEERRVTALDPVVGIEDRRVDDRAEALARRVRRVRRDERLDEDLVPVQHLVRLLSDVCETLRRNRTSERDRCGRCGEDRDPGRGEDESPLKLHCPLLLFAEVTEGRLASGGTVRKLEIPTVCERRMLVSEPVRELRARADAELAVGPRQRALDRVLGDEERGRDLAVRAAFGDERGDPALGLGQLVAGGRATADPGQLGARLLGPQRRAEPLEARERLARASCARRRAASPAAA